MAVQLLAPANTLPWLLPPQMPPAHQMNVYGYRLKTDGSHVITPVGERQGPIAQRVLAASMLRLMSREQIAETYGLCVRQVQEIVTGNANSYLTAPVRERLHRMGIGDPDARGYRGTQQERTQQVREALARLAVLAADMLRDWSMYTNDQRQEVATDLYLLSGAWREATA